jgi:hypothetical protein
METTQKGGFCAQITQLSPTEGYFHITNSQAIKDTIP